MLISFDLDDTLISASDDFATEPNPISFFLRPWMRESLRLGTKSLFKQLQQRGWEICIYTTSYRSEKYIKFWLWWYGLCINGFINGQKHAELIQDKNYPIKPSKYPPAFGIDLHVDDSEGVEIEAKKYGFEVVIIEPQDKNWTEKVLLAVESNQKI